MRTKDTSKPVIKGHGMTRTNKVIESIHMTVREMVSQAYREWKHQDITAEEFSTWMYDIRLTTLALVGNMAYLDILSEDDEAKLETYIRSLTDVYF